MNDLLPQNNNSNPELLTLIEEIKTDPEKAAKRMLDKDTYIKTVVRQKDEMRDEYMKLYQESSARETLESLADRLKEQPSEQPPATTEVPTKPSITKDEIESLVSTKLTQMKEAEKRQENFNQVKNKIIERYGANYQDSLAQQLTDLGMTSAELTDLAERNPKLVIKTLGLEREAFPQQRDFFSPPRSESRLSTGPAPQQVKDWDYYNNLRKTDPRKWMSREIQIEMHNSALALGDRFETQDYNRYAKDARVKF